MNSIISYTTSASDHISNWLLGDKPTIVTAKDLSNTHITQEIIRRCPSFQENFVPSPWLVSGHLQTIGVSMLRDTPDIQFERESLYMPDGGFVTLDWTSLFGEEHKQQIHGEQHGRISKSSETPQVRSQTDVPTVIIMHGLTGGSNESYVRHAVQEARKQGFNSIAFNYRGAAGTQLANTVMYSGAQTHDVRAVVKHLKASLPNSPLFAVGFSLGANILTKYVGEEGENCPLAGAVSISNPFKFVEASRYLHDHWFLRTVYSKALGGNLVRFFNKHRKTYENHEEISPSDIDRVKYLRDFDEYFTRRAGGYDSVDAYYTDASSSTRIHNIRVPYLAINALDDPISPAICMPYKEIEGNENTILITTKRGGHTGWLEGYNPLHFSNSWMDRVAFQFIKAVADARK
ncbi:hypothetical protein PROFUN_10112 [Planoprotostelium fungivorum]|uniref:AB hydrolase-1 domain-containing protein n=1 Tax=Planoprotostelium fungivorum TaxID=1890364 RepID=A0A2P6NEP9_9EUKA|nr:hypothetical protein PROFUN_10112 [Planoprotostelium fungivorum]